MPEIDVMYFIRIVWGARKRITLIVFAVAVIAALVSLILPKVFRADATVLPNTESSSELIRLAAMAGYATEGSDNSSELYPEILMSTRILKKIIQRKYSTDEFDDPVDLVSYWFHESDTPPAALLEKTLKRIRQGTVKVFKDKHTGIVTVSAFTGEPELSAEIVNAMLDELDLYNREYRKIKAKEQRIFIQARLDDEKNALNSAENALRLFRERNRRVVDSPALLLEQERLKRELELHSTLFLELKKQFELAKIEEVKNMPVVNVLDRAVPPVLRFSPRRKLIVIVTTMLSFAIVTFGVIMLDYYRNVLKPVLAGRQRNGA